jgi:aerobic-type carbon monoxide dehydrogenase small subunit (CoxS/CutS family)
MIMNAHALLLQSPRPSPQAILDGMENNLCRCGAHPRIIAAIEAAAKAAGGRS